MLSKIGSFINPALSKDDVIERPDHKGQDKGNGRRDDPPAEEDHDATFFSLDAISALLKQENIELGPDIITSLDLLQRHGVTSIPIRNEQPILAAIIDAAALLKGA